MANPIFYEGHNYDSTTEWKYAVGFNEVLHIPFENQRPTFALPDRIRYKVDFTLPMLGDGNVFFEVKGFKFEKLEKRKLEHASENGTIFMGDGKGFLYVPVEGELKQASLVRCLSCGEWHFSVRYEEDRLAPYFCPNHCKMPRLDIRENFFEVIGEKVWQPKERTWPLGRMSETPNLRYDDQSNFYVNSQIVNENAWRDEQRRNNRYGWRIDIGEEW